MTNLIDFTKSNVDQEKYFADAEYRAKVDAALNELGDEADAAEREKAADVNEELQKESEEISKQIDNGEL